ncbi:MAG: tyrosine-type recombinase/integrase [bacterium]|nr:tyrosine-type recombinase/integrase [bacterium]
MTEQLFSSFKDEILSYCDWRESLGFSDDHRKNLRKFDAYCCEFHPNETVITPAIVTGWITHEIKSGRHCIENKCSAIRSLSQYVGNGSYVLKEKFVCYKRNFRPYIFSDEELARLFAAADSTKNRSDPFFAETAGYIFRLIYTCGLRPQEARKLKCSDINYKSGEIIIAQSKLNKDRIVVAAPDVIEMLYQYKDRRSIYCNKEEAFFIHTDGSSITSEQLTNLFQKCWREANPNLEKHLLPKVRPYDLRHRFASAVLQKWIDGGKNLYAMLPYLRAYMGHEEIRDTLYYVHILPENLLTSSHVNWDQIESVRLEDDIWKR